MKNIDKLRINALTLVEAKHMADEIQCLSDKAESLQLALTSVSSQFRLELACRDEAAAQRAKEAAIQDLRHKTLWRKIRTWEMATGIKHAKLLEGTEKTSE